MKILGMDLGTKTLGLAISDSLGLIASPYKVIRYEDINNLADEVIDIVHKENIDKLVLGLPINMDNSQGFASERSINFKKLLETKTEKDIILIDERLSTVEAENILISADVSRKKRKKVIDEIAACIILDTYLRRCNNGK